MEPFLPYKSVRLIYIFKTINSWKKINIDLNMLLSVVESHITGKLSAGKCLPFDMYGMDAFYFWLWHKDYVSGIRTFCSPIPNIFFN